jgi:hypothetical protein
MKKFIVRQIDTVVYEHEPCEAIEMDEAERIWFNGNLTINNQKTVYRVIEIEEVKE